MRGKLKISLRCDGQILQRLSGSEASRQLPSIPSQVAHASRAAAGGSDQQQRARSGLAAVPVRAAAPRCLAAPSWSPRALAGTGRGGPRAWCGACDLSRDPVSSRRPGDAVRARKRGSAQPGGKATGGDGGIRGDMRICARGSHSTAQNRSAAPGHWERVRDRPFTTRRVRWGGAGSEQTNHVARRTVTWPPPPAPGASRYSDTPVCLFTPEGKKKTRCASLWPRTRRPWPVLFFPLIPSSCDGEMHKLCSKISFPGGQAAMLDYWWKKRIKILDHDCPYFIISSLPILLVEQWSMRFGSIFSTVLLKAKVPVDLAWLLRRNGMGSIRLTHRRGRSYHYQLHIPPSPFSCNETLRKNQ